MKTFKNFEDLKEAPAAIYHHFLDMEDGEITDEDFMKWYGGDAHLIENVADMYEINTTHVSAEDPTQWASILERSDVFDICRWLEGGAYVEICMMTTDAGGHSYFIPKWLADQVPNVERSIRKTEGESL
jgi:hypothetical protein